MPAPQVEYRTDPSQYRHIKLSFDGATAQLAIDIDENAGLRPGYKLKLNSYDLGVDIELHDALQRIRFEHPEVKTVVVTSAKDKVFCSGANIFMLGVSSHGWKVNFCKFTNETRNGIEDSSKHSGLKFIAAVNGACAGGGYELALACDEIILVDTDAICAAIQDVFQDTRSILEPAGALAVAGAKAYVERSQMQRQPVKNETLVAVACGANMNFDRLRFVAERAELGEAREAVFAVTIPEQRGSFRRFCALVGPRNVTEFNYRISDERQAHVFVGVQVGSRGESSLLARTFEQHDFRTLDLTHDELAKLHIRHLVGGKSTLAHDELLYRFEFPERPGALMRFLDSMAPNWNISLFHYRNQGGDVGRILVGLQVPAEEMDEFRQFLATLGYRYWDESANPVYKLFL